MSTQSHLTHLPNELIYRCFDYLSFHEILQSFTNLSSRFTYLTNNYWISIQIDNDLRQSQFKCLLHHLNPLQVRSLYFLTKDDERCYTHQFISLFPIENFVNVQVLKLNDISQAFLHSLLSNLHHLHQLSKLVILDYSEDFDDSQLIFEQLFTNRRSTLKSVALDFLLHYQPTSDSCHSKYSTSSNIEVLTLNCYVDNVHYFLSQTPMLKKLTLALNEIYGNNRQTTYVEKHLLLHIPSTLSYLKVSFTGPMDFYTMNTVTELFRLNCSSLVQLQYLVIVGDVHETFLDGQQWEQIIESYFPSLISFQFDFNTTNENNWNYIEYYVGDWITLDFDHIINSFKSDFWLVKHQWFVYGHTNDESSRLYTLPYCESSSFYLTTTLSIDNTYRTQQITSPVVPYIHKYEQTIQELTVAMNSDEDFSNGLHCYYFSNVNKLSLNSTKKPQSIVKSLSNVLNLDHVKQLELTNPIQLDSATLSNLLPYLSNLTILNVFYRMTNDFTFLNSIQNKRLLKHLEIHVLTKRDLYLILEILQNNAYSLMFKVRVDEDKFEKNTQQFIVDYLQEQIHRTSDSHISVPNFHVLNINQMTSWVTIEFNGHRDEM